MGNNTSVIPIGDKQVRIKSQLGEGGFAFVYVVEDVNTGEEYALKRMLAQNAESLKIATKEVTLMKTLRHPNIVTFYGACKREMPNNSTEYLILMEFCPGGHLIDFIQRRQGNKLPEDEVARIFLCVCKAVEYLHSQDPPIAHRDLKVENVLLARNGEFKLCDFGSTTTRAQVYETKEEIHAEEERIQKYSTSMYRAPEMADLYQKNLINEKVDIWALGCILYTVAFFTHPFQDGGNLSIISGKYRVPENHRYSPYLLALLKKIFVVNPAKRYDIKQVIKLVQEWQQYLRKGGELPAEIAKYAPKKKVKGKEEEAKKKPAAASDKPRRPVAKAASAAAGADSRGTHSGDASPEISISESQQDEDWDPFSAAPAPAPSSAKASPALSSSAPAPAGPVRSASGHSLVAALQASAPQQQQPQRPGSPGLSGPAGQQKSRARKPVAASAAEREVDPFDPLEQTFQTAAPSASRGSKPASNATPAPSQPSHPSRALSGDWGVFDDINDDVAPAPAAAKPTAASGPAPPRNRMDSEEHHQPVGTFKFASSSDEEEEEASPPVKKTPQASPSSVRSASGQTTSGTGSQRGSVVASTGTGSQRGSVVASGSNRGTSVTVAPASGGAATPVNSNSPARKDHLRSHSASPGAQYVAPVAMQRSGSGSLSVADSAPPPVAVLDSLDSFFAGPTASPSASGAAKKRATDPSAPSSSTSTSQQLSSQGLGLPPQSRSTSGPVVSSASSNSGSQRGKPVQSSSSSSSSVPSPAPSPQSGSGRGVKPPSSQQPQQQLQQPAHQRATSGAGKEDSNGSKQQQGGGAKGKPKSMAEEFDAVWGNM